MGGRWDFSPSTGRGATEDSSTGDVIQAMYSVLWSLLSPPAQTHKVLFLVLSSILPQLEESCQPAQVSLSCYAHKSHQGRSTEVRYLDPCSHAPDFLWATGSVKTPVLPPSAFLTASLPQPRTSSPFGLPTCMKPKKAPGMQICQNCPGHGSDLSLTSEVEQPLGMGSDLSSASTWGQATGNCAFPELPEVELPQAKREPGRRLLWWGPAPSLASTC